MTLPQMQVSIPTVVRVVRWIWHRLRPNRS